MRRGRRSQALAVGAAAIALLSAEGRLEAQGTVGVTGEVRVRTEGARPATAEGWDNFTLLRTRVGLLATLNPTVKAFVQLQDARVFGEEPATTSGSAAALDLHQGYIELGGTVAGTPLSLRAGRQEIGITNERLVGSVGWSNTGRSFDAAKLTLGSGDTKWSGGAFVATVHEGGERFGDLSGVALDGDHWLVGAHGGGALIDAYALYDRNAHFATYRGVDRATLGGRLQLPAGSRLSASLEGAFQTGTQMAGATEQNIEAWFTGARASLATGVKALPSLGVGLDYLSGDDDPTNSNYSAFNTLYATNHKYYGYMDLFLDPAARTRNRGLVDAIASAKAGLGRAGTLEIDLHRFQLAESAGLTESELGWELDLTYPFRITDAGRFTIGYSLFRNGGAAPSIGLGEDGKIWNWGFVQASVPF